MCKLKEWTASEIEEYDDARLELAEDGKIDCTRVYIKADVDKVIAELEENHKTEVKELLCTIRDKENNFNRAFDSEEKEIRHHKYKRCRAMAKWCDDAARLATWDADYRRCGWYNKWMQRWLKLAEQFKEAKL